LQSRRPMNQETRNTDEAQIRNILSNWAGAVRVRDSEGLLANVAPGILLFDLINPLQSRGSDALKKRAEEWLSSFQGAIDYETRDLSITMGDDVAFCHSLNRVRGTIRDGKIIDMWWRATVCF